MTPRDSSRDEVSPLGDVTNAVPGRWGVPTSGSPTGIPKRRRVGTSFDGHASPRRKDPFEDDLEDAVAWDGEGEGEDTPEEENAEEEEEEDALPLSVADLYRDHANDANDARPPPDERDEDDALCPVCARPLVDLADSELARVAHVNACLDGEEHLEERGNGDVGSRGGVVPGDGDGGGEGSDPRLGATWDEGGEGEWHDLAAWAHAVDQPKFAEAAVRAKLTFAALDLLGDADLRTMGIDTLGARKRILAAIAARRETEPAGSAGMARTVGTVGTMGTRASPSPGTMVANPAPASGWHPTRSAETVAPVFARAKAGADLRDSPPRPQGRPAGTTGTVGTGMMGSTGSTGTIRARSSRGPSGTRRSGTGRARSYVPPVPDPPPPPPWIRVPGTRFIVDGFHGYGKSHSGWCRHWFLTHFHADHYKGLTKSTPGPGCVVWCSRPTAELCRARLGVQRERLRVVDVGRPFRVDGVSCVFLDANHCPGAVMVLFDDIPGGSGPVLATGDFRFHADMCENPTLRALSLRAPALMLDTTYCDPRHVFPPQRDVLAAVRDAVRAEAFNPKTLFLFGTYTIGKERVFFEAARALGKKVYVGAQKRKVLEALGSSLSDEDRASITSDDASTNLHVVPMGSTSFARMKTILRYYRARFDTVVAFKPTGWTFEQSRKHARATARRARGALVQYAVPYSEHSSFDELRAFVSFLKPRAILPHVGNDRGPKARRMVELLTAPTSAEASEARGGDGEGRAGTP